MVSSGQKPAEVKAEVGAADKGAGKRGRVCPVLGPYILGSGPVSDTIIFGYVDDDPTHWEGFGQIPPQGGPHSDKEETSAREGQRVDIPPTGGRDGVGGDLRILSP